MKKIFNEQSLKLSIKNQQPVVLLYTLVCPFLIFIF